MNLEKVIFGFFIVFAATLNFGFFIGDIDNPVHHEIYELFAAVVVNLIATVLKFGDRTQIGAIHLATSLVADLMGKQVTVADLQAAAQRITDQQPYQAAGHPLLPIDARRRHHCRPVTPCHHHGELHIQVTQ